MTAADLAPLYIVGAGRLGTALGVLLGRAGAPLLGLWSRTAQGAQRAEALGLPCAHGALPAEIGRASTVILAVHDEAVAVVAGALLDGGLLRQARTVLHCGGARPAAEALAPLAPAPCHLGTLHPLAALANHVQALRQLPTGWFAVEGDAEARAVARALAARIGAGTRIIELEAETMTLYHTAAVIASNHAVALWHGALRLFQQIGLGKEQTLAALVALLRSTVDNVETLGLPDALTGPVRRGDPATVARHLEALQRHAPELAPVYRACTAAALATARAAGTPDEALSAIAALLDRSDTPPAGE
jgi:predicted short-subunit dehydrogenase-like oxidoreductase (DUF2520 family)